MIVFDELRITEDGQKMYITVHVLEADGTENIYLDSITVMTGDKVDETHPDTPTDEYIYHFEFPTAQGYQTKEATFILDKAEFDAAFTAQAANGADATVAFTSPDLSRDMFFVYFTWRGTPGECVPCDQQLPYDLGITFDDNPYYEQVMQYTRELASTCEVPMGFINLILQWHGLKAAISTGNYIPAYDMWKELMTGSKNVTNVGGSPRRCHCREV